MEKEGAESNTEPASDASVEAEVEGWCDPKALRKTGQPWRTCLKNPTKQKQESRSDTWWPPLSPVQGVRDVRKSPQAERRPHAYSVFSEWAVDSHGLMLFFDSAARAPCGTVVFKAKLGRVLQMCWVKRGRVTVEQTGGGGQED